ncbi:hypothetical protein CYMTET_11605 [Cymbomonas tetramitiformis]|uniref:C3H1-type domain-containing protein n=2 Tax=Cymbomonas tetramitiformis TaxID=36881 RepID=A0AAE0GM78_9CHLO|nr:hypothetical protein CYMTET_11605 [Cymbomonas tetramitiformis]
MAAVNEAMNGGSEECKATYTDLRAVTRMLAMATNADRKCDAVAPALDRCIRFFEAAKLESAVEILNFGLASGVFTPAVRDGQDEVTEKATLKPSGRDKTAFVAALVEAAEQCVEVLVTRLHFKIPEVPQQSASENRTSDKQAREDDDEDEENEEEAPGEEFFAETEEEAVAKKLKNKKGKFAAGVAPDGLAKDAELKRRMDAYLASIIPGYAPAAEKGGLSVFRLRERPSAKLRKTVVADPATGEMKSVSIPRLTKDQFLEQNMEMLEMLETKKERAQFRQYVAWIMKLADRHSWTEVYDFDAQVRSDIEDGRLDSWDPIRLGHRFQYEYVPAQREAQSLLEERTRDKGHKGVEKGKKDGICDFFQKKEGCKKGKDCGFIHVCRGCKSPEHGQASCEK